MALKPLLFPLLAMVALTLVVMLRMYLARVAEFKAKRIDPDTVKTRHTFREKITDSAHIADNFSNLFEMPVLFYVAMLLAINLLVSDALLVSLAWAYVGLRVVHSAIHTTYNRVMHRFYAFAASALVLLAIWIRLAAILLLN
jgi:hypothetical protein